MTTANSAEAAMPKRTSLPSMLPPARGRSAAAMRVAAGFGPVGDRDAGEEQHAPSRRAWPSPARWSPTMRPNVLVSAAGMAKIASICTKLRERGRVLERVRGVGVEEAAAVGAEHLDRVLRGDRADARSSACRLRASSPRRRRRASAARPARPGTAPSTIADRQQHVERRSG